MKALIGILMLSLFSVSLPTVAGDCDEIDLNKSSPLKDMPIQDQGTAGICYAYTGAELLEFEQRLIGKAIPLSAVDLGFTAFAGKNPMEGGQVKDVVGSAVVHGVASKACVDNAIHEFTKDTSQTSEQFITILDTLYSSANRLSSPKELVSDAAEKLRRNASLNSCSIEPTLEKMIHSKHWGKGLTDSLKSILYSCDKKRIPLPKYSYVAKMEGSDSEVRTFLDERLDKKKPAGVNLCSEIFDGIKPHRGLKGMPARGAKENMNGCGAHSAMVVGRKEIGGKCHYLIRNSRGGSWRGKGLQCACKRSTGYYSDCSEHEKAMSDLKKDYEKLDREYTNQELELHKAQANSKAGKINTDEYAKIYKAYSNASDRRNAAVSKYRAAHSENVDYVGCWIEANNLISNTFQVGQIQ